MKLTEINEKKQAERNKNLELVRNISTEHSTTSTKKIQNYLVEENKTAISQRTIKRYLLAIKKENKKIKKINRKAKIIIPEDKSYCIDPINGKRYKLPSGGILELNSYYGTIFFDTKDRIWRYSNNKKPFDKDKKLTVYKPHSKLSFEYDDLND